MIEPCCAVCGESKAVNLYMFNNEMCLCHRCMETAARSFIRDAAERKLKESEKKLKASRVEEAAIKFANGTHESLMCKCPGCGKRVPEKDMKRFNRGEYYRIFSTRFCPDCFREKNREQDLQQTERKLEKTVQALDTLKAEYESFRKRTGRVWWGMTIAGIAIGTLLTLMFLNPR
nr:MAG TPA: YokU-like protein [Caudoviricetes sp.]